VRVEQLQREPRSIKSRWRRSTRVHDEGEIKIEIANGNVGRIGGKEEGTELKSVSTILTRRI